MTRRALLLAGTAALFAAPAAAQVSDFRLQPAPTPTPQVIGPLPDTPAPHPAPTPAPRSTTPAPAPGPAIVTPTPTPVPRIAVPSVVTPKSPPAPRAAAPAPRPTAIAPTAAVPSTTPPIAPPSVAPGVSATPAPAPAARLPSFPTPSAGAEEKPAGSWWPWIVAVFLLGGGAFSALWWLRRRVGPMGPLVVPEIERPRIPPTPEPSPEAGTEPGTAVPQPEPEPVAASSAEEAHPLHIAIELRKLTLTFMNATLGYRLTLTNAGAVPLEGIGVAADLIGAHASLPRETQLAGPATELPVRHYLAGLAPGESGDVAGELRLPLNQLRPITQGSAQLFVPLARFRVGADGQEARCFTLVAGQPSPSGNGAIQPVRLDHGPRIYDGLAGRAF